MRIAFDVDGTLTPLGHGQFASAVHAFPLSLAFREPLRDGAIRLMRELRAEGHDVWIYTSSFRSIGYMRLWFLFHGVRLGGVVNGELHREAIRGHMDSPSKFPPAFGIDLLIDDQVGVEIEGSSLGFRVLIVDPGDSEWTDKVRAAVRSDARKGV